MKKDINVFLAHTPFHCFMIKAVLETIGISQNAKTNILFHTTPIHEKMGELFDDAVFIDKRSLVDKIIKTREARVRMESYLESSAQNQVNFYISHTGAALDNYVFHQLKSKHKNINVSLFYDGVLYFYKYKQPYKRKEHLSRKIYGTIFNLKYVYDENIIPTEFSKIDKIYTPFPSYSDFPKEKMVQITFDKVINQHISKGKCLILGGYFPFFSQEEEISLYSEMLREAKRNGATEFVFKRHHSGGYDTFEIAINHVHLKYHKFELDEPIEEVIGIIQPALIYSYPTSALINLKGMLSEKHQLKTFFPENCEIQGFKQMFNVFSKLSIPIIQY